MIDPASLAPENSRLAVKSQWGVSYLFHYRKIILIAGEGNENLLALFGCKQPKMQRRPLKMVVMRGGPGCALNDMIYAHCLGASVNPRITITSHRDSQGNIVWYMGGQLAEDGVNKSDAELIGAAKSELNDLIPWLELNGAEWGVLEINRAEIKKPGTTRPDSFSIEVNNNIITAWPTKLALSPALADALLEKLDQANTMFNPDLYLPDWQQPVYADFPWNEEACWKTVSDGDM